MGDLAQFDDVIRGRRTIGAFRPECPPREIVLDAIELARWAPNHKKTEPWRFTLLGSQAVSEIIALNAELVAAKKGPDEAEKKKKKWSAVPGWLLVTCRRCDDAVQTEEDYAACCCAIQNFTLALWARGIGTKWSTGDVIRHPRFTEICRFDPQDERVVGLIWYGSPDVIPSQTRRPVAEIVREIP